MGTQPKYAIELRELTKTFGNVVANDRVSLALERGRSSPCWERTAAARPR